MPSNIPPKPPTPILSPSALDGIQVLDFSHALAGPYCTLLLSDYGAKVYKLEAQNGDMGRGWGPPFAGGISSFFLGLNRGKEGISINLKEPEGLDLCLKLVDRVDVLVENFRPGSMDRLGLGYAQVRERNPRLIYCSISGYGQQGPSRDEAAMDLVVQASSGLLSITGTEAGDSVRCGYGVTDVTAGLFSVIGILLALRSRERTGLGQFVDVSMLDSMISTMSSNYMSYLGSNVVPRPMGTSFPTVVPYQVFHTSDREIAIAVGSEKLWAAFCRALGRPDLERHPDYETNAARIQNREALENILSEIFRQKSVQDWITRLQSAGIPCSLARNFAEVAEHPQCEVREMFPWMNHPTAGKHRVTGTPVKLSSTPGRPSSPAPLLGQHTRSVLKDLFALNDHQIDDLLKRRVVFESTVAKESNP
ncbi:MAG: CoA transferase [Candidatus Sulfotelmatobacter sp.]|jgi:crotonobetainyl-CoA:carnitine CoA-transferase CaiB-like acyl-CoA transferase